MAYIQEIGEGGYEERRCDLYKYDERGILCIERVQGLAIYLG